MLNPTFLESITSALASAASVLGDYPYFVFLFLAACNVVYFLSRWCKHSKITQPVMLNAEQELLMEADQCIVVDENDVVLGMDSKRNCHLRSKGLKLHRAFSIFIFDEEGKMLMQKRSSDKITFPSCWANTCCSHPLHVEGELETESDPTHPNFGMGAKVAARRKLLQELGIPPEQVPLESMTFMTRLHYKADLDEKWGEHEVDYLLVCRPPGKVTVKVNPNEVDQARWFTQEELSSFCIQHKDDNKKVQDLKFQGETEMCGNKKTKEQEEEIAGFEPISPWFAAIEKSPHLLHKWWSAIRASLTPRMSPLDHVRDPSTIHRGGVLFYYSPSTRVSEPPVCPTHKHSYMETLMRPGELIDALRFKAMHAINKRMAGPVLQFEKLEHQQNQSLQKDLIFCEMTLNKVSRSFAVVIAGLHPTLRVPVAVFYLILRALDTVEDETDLSKFVPSTRYKEIERRFVADDVVGFERQVALLSTFYQRLPLRNTPSGNMTSDELDTLAIDGIGGAKPEEQDLLEKLGCVLRVFAALPDMHQDVIADITRDMANGMVEYAGRDLGSGTETTKEYNKYCHYVAGLVGIGLTRQFVVSGLENGTDSRLDLNRDGQSTTDEKLGGFYLSNSMGLFLQKTNIIRDYLEDLLEGRSFWPKDIWSKYSPNGLDKLTTKPDQALACLNHMVTDALQHGQDSLVYLDALTEPSVFAFCAVPQVMAIATMAEVYNEPRLFTGVLKIRKSLAASIMLRCTSMQDVKKWFAQFATQILDKVDVNDPNAQRTIALAQTLGGIYTPNNKRDFSADQHGFFRTILNAFGCWCGFKPPPKKSTKML